MPQKYHALFHKVFAFKNLLAAWEKVAMGGKCPGVDGITLQRFRQRLQPNLLDIQHRLRYKTYRPRPLREVRFEKPSGGFRCIMVPTIRDRVVTTALLRVLDEVFAPDLHPASFGFVQG
jgi:retron-type reverse transcriptase